MQEQRMNLSEAYAFVRVSRSCTHLHDIGVCSVQWQWQWQGSWSV